MHTNPAHTHSHHKSTERHILRELAAPHTRIHTHRAARERKGDDESPLRNDHRSRELADPNTSIHTQDGNKKHKVKMLKVSHRSESDGE